MNKYILVDETDFIQLGMYDEEHYEEFSFEAAQPSVMNEWPTTETPGTKYKLASFWIEFGQSLTVTERQTYSFLDLVGDVGGLWDGLSLFAGIGLAPFAMYAMRSTILREAFRKEPEHDELKI